MPPAPCVRRRRTAAATAPATGARPPSGGPGRSPCPQSNCNIDEREAGRRHRAYRGDAGHAVHRRLDGEGDQRFDLFRGHAAGFCHQRDGRLVEVGEDIHRCLLHDEGAVGTGRWPPPAPAGAATGFSTMVLNISRPPAEVFQRGAGLRRQEGVVCVQGGSWSAHLVEQGRAVHSRRARRRPACRRPRRVCHPAPAFTGRD